MASDVSWAGWEVGRFIARSSETAIVESVFSLNGVGVSVMVTWESRPS